MKLCSKSILKSFIAFAAFCSSLSAIEVRFVPLNQEIASRMLAVRDDKAQHTLKKLHAMIRTEPVACTNSENPIHLVALDREDEKGSPASTPVTLAAGIKAPLVLILPDAEHPTGLRAIALDESEESFQWGGLLFINTCKPDFMARIENERIKLPGNQTPVHYQPGGEARNMGVQLYREEKDDEILFSGIWDHDPNFRKMIIIIPPNNPKRDEFDLVFIPQDKRVQP